MVSSRPLIALVHPHKVFFLLFMAMISQEIQCLPYAGFVLKILWTVIDPKRLGLLTLFQRWQLGHSISYQLTYILTKLVLNVKTNCPYTAFSQDFFKINHFCLCPAEVSCSQPLSKWLRRKAIKCQPVKFSLKYLKSTTEQYWIRHCFHHIF